MRVRPQLVCAATETPVATGRSDFTRSLGACDMLRCRGARGLSAAPADVPAVGVVAGVDSDERVRCHSLGIAAAERVGTTSEQSLDMEGAAVVAVVVDINRARSDRQRSGKAGWPVKYPEL